MKTHNSVLHHDHVQHSVAIRVFCVGIGSHFNQQIVNGLVILTRSPGKVVFAYKNSSLFEKHLKGILKKSYLDKPVPRSWSPCTVLGTTDPGARKTCLKFKGPSKTDLEV